MPVPPPAPNLGADLVKKLREARSPLDRVRVIARAWRAVRSLTPKQRYEVAAQLGLDGAGDLVEAIAAHQGTAPPAELMKAVNEVQTMDPATLKSIADRVRDPRQRGEVLKQGLQAMGAVLAGSPPAPPAPPAALKAPDKPAPPPPPPIPVVAPAPIVTPAPVAPPAPAVVPVPVSPPVPAVVPVPPPPPQPRPEPVRPPEPPAPVRSTVAESLAAVPGLTARFRRFRQQLDPLRRLSAGELREVLEAFPDGWARRRVLSELIEAGVPARTADALSLIDVLQSPRDRAWCLGAVAETRTLSPEERSTLLQAAETPAGRWRLELRLGDR